MEGISLGQYMPGGSAIHRLDPRTKLLAAVIIILTVMTTGWSGILAALPALAAGVLLARIPAGVLWQQVRELWLLLVITALIQVLLTPGNVIFKAGPFNVTGQGLEAGLHLFISISMVIMAGILLTATTTTLNLASGLESLLGPLKRVGLPVHEVVMAVTIAVRFVPDVFQEARTIAGAQISRGAGLYGPGAARRAGAIISVMVPLVAGALRRSEELATAMEARSYRGGEGRTRMNGLTFSGRDAACALITLGVPAAAAMLRGAVS